MYTAQCQAPAAITHCCHAA